MHKALSCDDINRYIISFLDEGELLFLKLSNRNYSNTVKTNVLKEKFYTSSIEKANIALENGCDVIKLIYYSIFNQNVETVKYLILQYPEYSYVVSICLCIIENPNIDIFEWSRKKLPQITFDINAYNIACKNGHLNVIKFLLHKGLMPTEKVYLDAAEYGHLHILKYIKITCPTHVFNSIIYSHAAINGHIEIIEWLKSLDPQCPWDDQIMSVAAANGQIETLKWLRSQGYPWDKFICIRAARSGQLKTIQWLISQNPQCPLDDFVYSEAVKYGHFEIIKWLRFHSPRCYLDCIVFEEAIKYGNLEMIKWLISENCIEPRNPNKYEIAISEGNLEVLNFFDSKELRDCIKSQSEKIIIKGHLHFLKWCKEKNIKLNLGKVSYNYAIYNKHYEIIKWLLSEGYEYHKDIYCFSIVKNDLIMMNFLRSLNFPFYGGEVWVTLIRHSFVKP